MPTTAADIYLAHPERSEIDDVLAQRGVGARTRTSGSPIEHPRSRHARMLPVAMNQNGGLRPEAAWYATISIKHG